MAASASAGEQAAKVSRSRNVPWFHPAIGPALRPAFRELLEKHSEIASADVEEHIYEIVRLTSTLCEALR